MICNMKIKEYNYFACDFETTVYEGQERTEVWSACIGKLFDETTPIIFNDIVTFFKHIFEIPGNNVFYFHNLKFDGAFILDFLFRIGYNFNRVADRDMKNKEFKCSISQMGQWYTITIKNHNKILEFRDSLKLMPFSLAQISKAFQTKHKKLDMEYKGYRYAGCEISEKEREYIINDVLVLKEALEIMFSEGHDRLTIGSCCMKEFESEFDKEDYNNLFPNLYDFSIDENLYGYPTAGDYIRASYRGGVCLLKKGVAGKVYKELGNTYDVNSLYPSMMHSESGNYFPVGKPKFWTGYIPYDKLDNKEWFVRFSCRFYLKKNYLPTVQIKRNLLYKSTEYLMTSDVYYNGSYHREYINVDGELTPAIVTMTMTRMDFERFLQHYNVEELKIHDGCYFYREIGIFDDYIEKYKKIKLNSVGAKKTLAKLYLNNLYGKFSASTDSSYKEPFYDEEKDCVRFRYVEEHNKKPGYIPVGSYITSYSRNFTLKACQENYDNFCYCDTDSMHILGDDVKGITIDPLNFCCWKNESTWDEAVFLRQKTYIEHVIAEDNEKVEPYNNIKCAGMPERCKEFFNENYSIHEFRVGLSVPGKLLPKRIKGGIILVDTPYEIKFVS